MKKSLKDASLASLGLVKSDKERNEFKGDKRNELLDVKQIKKCLM